jgi:hypothetical protein
MDDSYNFCNYEDIFPQRLHIFNTLSPTLSSDAVTNVVKFPASTPEHIMKILFQIAVICKMASM